MSNATSGREKILNVCSFSKLFSVFVPHLFFHICSLRDFNTSWFGWVIPLLFRPSEQQTMTFTYLGVPENSRKHTCSCCMPPGLDCPWCSKTAARRDPCLHNMRIVLESVLPLAQRSRNSRQIHKRACICLSVDFSNPVQWVEN